MSTQPSENASAGPEPRDAQYWAKAVRALQLGEVPTSAVNLNVTGRRLVGPIQGFGQLWQKTYSVDLGDAGVSPKEVISTWKQRFATFWPAGNKFYGPLTGIAPGEVALLNVSMPGRLLLSTGVLVLYADDESFAFMTPQGHMFASWITFSAAEVHGRTVAQILVLLRAGDPLYELVLPFGGHRQEDRFWQHTLRALARHFGVPDPRVQTSVVCVDRRRQWSRIWNVWHNAAVRSALYQAATLLRKRVAPIVHRRRIVEPTHEDHSHPTVARSRPGANR
jgi:hypothetical protein